MNPFVRTSSIELFRVIMEKNATDVMLEMAVNELLSLPRLSKTAGPDHRATLYAMLSSIKPSHSVSRSIVQVVPPLLARETHDVAVSLLATAIPQHIDFLLHVNEPLLSETTNLIAREMNNAKPMVRRAFCSLVGKALWESENAKSEAFLAFATAVLSSLESNLKNVSASPISSAGPLAGYIASALLLGPLGHSGRFGKHLTHFLLVVLSADTFFIPCVGQMKSFRAIRSSSRWRPHPQNRLFSFQKKSTKSFRTSRRRCGCTERLMRR
jgi:hypothetical protein